MEENKATMQETQKTRDGSTGCLVAILITVILMGCLIFAIATTRESGRPMAREATNADVTFRGNWDGLTSYKLILVPEHDIDDLIVTVRFYNEDRELIKTMHIPFGNVKEGVQYQHNLGVGDFSLPELLDLSYCRFEVTGGTISLIGG